MIERATRSVVVSVALAALSIHCSTEDAAMSGLPPDGGAAPDVAPTPSPPPDADAGEGGEPKGPFELTLSPSALLVGQGKGAQITVSVARDPAFAGPVKVQLDALPTGVTATPLTIANSATSGTLYLSATAAATLATSTVTVRGISEGNEKAVPYRVRVVGPTATLDTTFGTGGKVVSSLGPPKSDTANAALVQKDGKVIVVGTSDQGTSLDFALARYDIDGSLDPTFGTAGVALTNFDFAQDSALAATFDSVGRIVVVGTSTSASTSLALARYSADGKLDTSFGVDGKITTTITSSNDVPTSIAVDSSGRILVGLRVPNPSAPPTYRYRVVRFTSVGLVDPGFGSPTGALFSQGYNYRRSVFLLPQSGDRVVLLGNTTYGTIGNTCTSFALERLGAGGALDAMFGTNGHTYTRLGHRCNYPDSIAVQSDGKILAAGNSWTSPENLNENLNQGHDLGLARYTADGLPDTTFNTTGTFAIPTANNDSKATGVIEQRDRKILLAGWSNGNFVTMRFLPDGTPDPEWGFGDLVPLDFDGGTDLASAVVILPDDRIVVVGTSNKRFALARYWP